MKAINTGNVYEIFDDSLHTYDKLPAQSYVVRFNMNRGFFLEKYVDIEITEDKIYGVHMSKVDKVLNSFGRINRSLGVILSGDKGIGKSLFAKILAAESINRDIPLIVVDKFVPGIASYIESIEQEVMVLFDEFDKTFGEVTQGDGEASPQAQLLSLFDGVSGGKKLFVITCNDLHRLNDYLINRPGRFHYHFRFEYPSAEEVRAYLEDKIPAEQYCEIDDVVAFSRKVSLNYDCLRAIAFELCSGVKFKDAIKDLNIVNLKVERYNVSLCFDNGMTAIAKNVALDLFSDDTDETYLYLYDKSKNYVDIRFNASNSKYCMERQAYVVEPDDIEVIFDEDESYKDLVSQAKSAEVVCLIIQRHRDRDIHYAV